jgi:hypothetical protein
MSWSTPNWRRKLQSVRKRQDELVGQLQALIL